jgi:hypothetical protein
MIKHDDTFISFAASDGQLSNRELENAFSSLLTSEKGGKGFGLFLVLSRESNVPFMG